MARSSHRTPHRASGCISTLTIAVFPLAIYVREMLGKASGIAAILAGILIVLKVLGEWHQHHQPHQPRTRRPPQQAPLAGCYFCQRVQVLRPYRIEGMRVGVCPSCYQSLRLSRWTT